MAETAPACEGAPDPEIWFPERGSDVAIEQEAHAKAACFRCDYRSPCLEFALATDQRYGIWGGTNHNQRVRILTRRRYDEAANAGSPR
ncbi:WhiB family transcriptional regulator [Winogradskya consettensis]